MANNKMLIDASHPEETRVAVVRGNRIEEFDFESQAKKQIRGNIYLAKVTRVEPSLQAAFIDYGGNRHGFLAFSEIHPDYYQIPVADRLALLEEEAREASENDDDEDGGRSRRRNRNGGDRRPQGGSRSDRPARGAHARDNGDEAPVAAEADEDEDGFIEEPEEVTEIVHGRVSDADDADIADDDSDAAEEADQSAEDEDGDGPGRSMAAMVETDSISEPAPKKAKRTGNLRPMRMQPRPARQKSRKPSASRLRASARPRPRRPPKKPLPRKRLRLKLRKPLPRAIRVPKKIRPVPPKPPKNRLLPSAIADRMKAAGSAASRKRKSSIPSARKMRWRKSPSAASCAASTRSRK